MKQELARKTLIAGAIAAALTLAACGDNRTDSAARPADRSTASTVAPAATPSDRVTADASAAMNRTENKVENAADRAGDKVENTAERAGNKLEAAGDKMAAGASDAATTAKVKARLMAEPGIDSLQIDVDTNNGRVTLTGEADTPQNKARAKELAGSIEGVNGVVDRLTVKR